jgi:xanthine dehydrogenase accessory factor
VGDPDDVLEHAADWLAAGRGVALATVVETWGSSPRPAGSQLAVDERGAFVGSVSGGCIEGAVVQTALEVIGGGAARPLEFGVTNERAWEVGLACGGRIKLWVERADPRVISTIQSERAAGRPVALATDLVTGEQQILTGGSVSRQDSGLDGDRFARVWNPPLRMIIVGAVHVAQSLARLAAVAGFAVTVVDPRRAFATEERFPGVSMSTRWPDKALAELGPDRRTAIITLTHDPKLDDPALAAALASPAFYLGALGSKKTHAARNDRLRAEGLGDDALARIHGPVGLPIGARTAGEIAVSILAEVIQELRKAP